VLRRSKTGGSWVSTQNLLSTHFLFTVYRFSRSWQTDRRTDRQTMDVYILA